MNDKSREYFYNQLLIEDIFEPEDRVVPAVWEFSYNFNSLYRYWLNIRSVLELHVNTLNSAAEGDGSAEFDDVFSETAGVDVEFMPKYLRLSTISFALALVESLLSDLSEWAAEQKGMTVDLPSGKLPYMNKYLVWLVNDCGLALKIDNSLMESLDTLRRLRNQFLHKLSGDIPAHLTNVMSDVISDVVDETNTVTDEVVEHCFSRLAEFAKSVELACDEFD